MVMLRRRNGGGVTVKVLSVEVEAKWHLREMVVGDKVGPGLVRKVWMEQK